MLNSILTSDRKEIISERIIDVIKKHKMTFRDAHAIIHAVKNELDVMALKSEI